MFWRFACDDVYNLHHIQFTTPSILPNAPRYAKSLHNRLPIYIRTEPSSLSVVPPSTCDQLAPVVENREGVAVYPLGGK